MLHLREPSLALWERFFAGDVTPGERAAHPVLERWARVQTSTGTRPDGSAAPEGTSDDDLRSRRDRVEGLFIEGSSVLEPLAEKLAHRGMMAVVADTEGFVLRAHVGKRFHQRALQTRLVEGAHWSEAARGTNAIGTALAEGTSVSVVGRAHYEQANHGLFCYAAPIRDAFGEIVAVFDVTGGVESHSPVVGVAVESAAEAIAHALRMRAYASVGGYRLVEALVQRAATPALLVEAAGFVRTMNDPAGRALGLAGHRRADTKAPLSVERVFGVPFSVLAREASAGRREAQFEARGVRHRLTLEPLLDGDGRAYSMVVYLDRLAAPAAAPAPRPPLAPAFDVLLGSDPLLTQAKAAGTKFAKTELPIMLLAETGTGKELFARAIHRSSPRKNGPFVALNCGSLSSTLLESELFGYAPGAFTGAQRQGQDGKIASADGGTLFLDEIAEMPEALQAMLLRVLEDGTYRRVGDTRERRADFRLVCATCRDLPRLVETGVFRSDLYYRIQGAVVELPPLRARVDREELAQGLVESLAASHPGSPRGMSDDALALLREHAWPGNVRELKTALTHALIMAEG
ncbi:MAG: sigma-54-dependent Fis family transcriptional regulator, partial [Polyangiaceae bacterium]|nr:sigma-54-dependent Fis family transcriptional regulator [Polyangiaceae bacterium]